MNEWIGKHKDTVIILTGIIGSFLWMNSSINCLKDNINGLKTDMAVVKAVLILKNVMPAELAKKVIPDQKTEL